MSTLLLLAACRGPAPGSGGGSADPGDSGHDSFRPDSGETADTAEPVVPVAPGWEGLAELGVTSVVLVHVDTLRADRLTLYGGEHDTLPTAGAWDWAVVDGLVAPTSWTIPSTVSLFTALDTPRHGLVHTDDDGAMNQAFDEETLIGRLSDEGLRTGMWSGNQALPQIDGVLDDFDEVWEAEADLSTKDIAWEVEQLLAWIDTLPAGQPFFAVLQPMDTHQPYEPAAEDLGSWSDPTNPPFDVHATEDEQLDAFRAAYEAADEAERARLIAELRAIYDEGVLRTDRGITAVIEGLAARGLARDTLVVVSSDHGEGLGDDLIAGGVGAFGHGGSVRPELVRLPLLFHHPALPAQRIDCLSQNFDLLPTLRRALGLPDVEGVDGVALQDGCRDVAHASVWFPDTDHDVIRELTATDGTAFLRWRCAEETALRYDLSVDPTATTTVDAADFPAEAALAADLETYLEVVQENIAHTICPVD